jgi:cytochrome c-type biogenesis protein CcmH/NrfF
VRRLWLAVAVCAGLLALGAGPGLAATPKTTVNDVEDEVMCPICGTLLELAESPQAKREKVYVAKLVAEGKTKAEIKDALVTQYGPSVLATPKASGFDLSAYLVPILALLVAVVVLAFSLSRWRRDGAGPAPGGETRSRPQGEDAERLDADLSRYDL